MHDSDQHDQDHDYNHDQNEDYTLRLEALRLEHRDLDEVIQRLSEEPDIDDFQLRRMKKRKLHIKDQISLLESRLIPDMNA
ncbi:MAG: YdcH family protein [Candidatus Competibacteraceae bacterium]|nr:YdcH family protein [Candidatus Competibacteraceae bacterium]MCB1805548.1 YdcH family protein [Candidatus Competibacteraceae bacterium]MCB1812416.1 YdcH family protein [Candidatus Competibacteraceae bacterium]